MGVVYRAFDVPLARVVAVKTLPAVSPVRACRTSGSTPPELAAFLERALHADRRKRPGTAREFRLGLEQTCAAHVPSSRSSNTRPLTK